MEQGFVAVKFIWESDSFVGSLLHVGLCFGEVERKQRTGHFGPILESTILEKREKGSESLVGWCLTRTISPKTPLW